MGQAQINVRTRACSRTSIARTRQAALTHNVRGKELISSQKYILLYFNSTNYGCGFRFLTGYNKILIPDKEWDLLGHILVPNWGVRKG